MKGLTLTQPYATLVALLAKLIETRSWATKYRGELAIHAGQGLGPVGEVDGLISMCEHEPFRTVLTQHGIMNHQGAIWKDKIPRGAIVAVVELVDCRPTVGDGHLELRGLPDRVSNQERAFGDYSLGRYGWILANVRPLREPVPCKGAQRLWNVPAEVEAQIREALR